MHANQVYKIEMMKKIFIACFALFFVVANAKEIQDNHAVANSLSARIDMPVVIDSAAIEKFESDLGMVKVNAGEFIMGCTPEQSDSC